MGRLVRRLGRGQRHHLVDDLLAERRRDSGCWTEETLTPTALAIAAPVQWVASCGGSVAVSATTWSMTFWPSGATRGGRVLSRNRPSTPSAAKRSCQRQTQVFDLPVRRIISTVPRPSAVNSTISARQACF